MSTDNPVKTPASPIPAASADSIAAAATAATRRGPPPVHLWNPPFCGDIDMRIARDGTWYYLGTPIGRKPLVKLFSSIIRRDDASYFLVTPAEKVGIRVDDAPFVAVDFDIAGAGPGQTLTFTTNVDDTVVASPANPVRVEIAADGTPSPYILVRSNLWALIDRKSFYRLVEIGHPEGAMFGIRSGGAFFPVIATDRLDSLA
jgi:hypothetical protein